MIKKVLTNSAIYGLAPHVPRIVSVLLLPIMTAHLTDVDYGIAGTIAAYTMALSALSTLGVHWAFSSIKGAIRPIRKVDYACA